MERRDYLRKLRVVGAGGLTALAGCSTESSVASMAQVSRVASIPDALKIRPEVELPSEQYSEESAVRVRVGLVNTGSDRRILSHEPLDYQDRLSVESALWLCTQDAFKLNQTDSDQWAIERGLASSMEASLLTSFDAGARVGREYLLVDNADNSGYLEPGSYTWKTRIGIAPDGPTPAKRGEDTAFFDWGFSIELTA